MAIRDLRELRLLDAEAGEEAVFLKGRPPMGEFLGFVRHQSLGGSAVDLTALSDEWRAANDHVQQLELSEAGLADDPSIEDLPDTLDSKRAEFVSNPVVKQSFAVVPFDVRLVEIDRLVVFQKVINLDHVRRIKTRLGPSPSQAELFDACLPLGNDGTSVVGHQIANNAWVFVSPSNDLRVLDTTVLHPDQVLEHTWSGFPASIVGFAIGFGVNALSAIQVGRRLVLNNGSHRAYALREMGISKVPCLIQRVSRRDELEVVANEQLVKNADYFLTAPRPPLLKDYFDNDLRTIVRVPKRARQLKLVVASESLDTPLA